ncbi:hypothetical protein C2845_PM05G04230 [Panicum miliaceum]|uniref:Uncharacterized protein n=1 Tax=Panicum miliaceum TaxID=4540 RepID=A0A3L6SYE6_PANMI|nr:hypothetical protein C2845_PM05G04230 [Panicum miliaceum]
MEPVPDGNAHGHKRPDLEKTAGELADSGDAKRPREGNHDRAMEMDMDDDDEEEVDMEQYKPFGMYCKNWIYLYGDWAKFDDPIVTGRPRRRRGVIQRVGVFFLVVCVFGRAVRLVRAEETHGLAIQWH